MLFNTTLKEFILTANSTTKCKFKSNHTKGPDAENNWRQKKEVAENGLVRQHGSLMHMNLCLLEQWRTKEPHSMHRP